MNDFHWAFTLPYPPSLNTYYRMYKGKMLISEKGRGYIRLIGDTLMLPTCSGEKWTREPLIGNLSVRILVYFPDKRKRDLDNLLKALLDALQKNGLYKDDSQITELEIVKRFVVKKNGEIFLTIQPDKRDY